MPDATSPDPQKTRNATPDRVQRAYASLGVDVGYLSAKAAAWFGDVPPPHFHTVTSTPVVCRLVVGTVSVAVILFPPLEPSQPLPSQALLASLVTLANAHADADIRIGISPWGFQAERQACGRLAQAYHVLLGAGEGAPFPLSLDSSIPSLVWSRSDHDGRSLIVLDLFQLPAPEEIMVWEPGFNIIGRDVSLSALVRSDPAMKRLLEE